MVWIRILVVTPLVLVMAVLLLSFLALQAVFAGEGRTRPAYAGDGDYSATKSWIRATTSARIRPSYRAEETLLERRMRI